MIDLVGYYPGLIGRITLLHATYYAEHWNLDVSFESQVGRELSEFMGRFDPDRDGLWAALEDGRFVGAIAIDGSLGEAGEARLRWFIVDHDCQGCGVGRRLMEAAVGHCREKGFERIFLWTFKGLDAARKLYEDFGFRLVEENPEEQWGISLQEQRFDLELR